MGNKFLLFFQGERSNSYDSLPCRVWNELQEKNNNKNVGYNNYSNKNDKSVVNYEKNDKIKKLVVHVPVSQNVDKYTGNDNRGGYLTYDRKNLIAEGFKRGPGFRSWGGKRDFPGLFPTDEGENFKNEEGMKKKRTRFTSWGGKRNYQNFMINDFEHFQYDDDDVKDVNEKNFKSEDFRYGNEKKNPNEDFKKYLSRRELTGEYYPFKPVTNDILVGNSNYPGNNWKNVQKFNKNPFLPYDYYYHYYYTSLLPGYKILNKILRNGYGNGDNFYRQFGNAGAKRNENEKFGVEKPLIRNFNSWGGKKGSKSNKDYQIVEYDKKINNYNNNNNNEDGCKDDLNNRPSENSNNNNNNLNDEYSR